MNEMQKTQCRKARVCIFGVMLFSVALYGQSTPATPAQSKQAPVPASSVGTATATPIDITTLDAGVPEVTVTDGVTMISTDINGAETTAADTTTLAPGSPALSPTSLSTSTTTASSTKTAAPLG